MKSKSSKRLIIAIIIVVFLMLGVLITYVTTFPNGISTDHKRWGEFGSILGPLTSLLAFTGVLYTIKQSENRSERTEERDIFFQLLNLYQKQINNIKIQQKKVKQSEIEGTEAVQGIFKIAKQHLMAYNIYIEVENTFDFVPKLPHLYNDISEENYAHDELCKLYDAFDFTDLKSKMIQMRFDGDIIPDTNSINQHFREYGIHILADKLQQNCKHRLSHMSDSIMQRYFSEKNSQYFYNAFKYVSDRIYEEYEDQLGQYFRNIYYLLDLTDSFYSNNQYIKIFRAQLSKFEILLLLLNSVSAKSTMRTVYLLKKYDIFNNLNCDEFGLFNNTKNDINEFINGILAEYEKQATSD